jgi:hypothetical protein
LRKGEKNEKEIAALHGLPIFIGTSQGKRRFAHRNDGGVSGEGKDFTTGRGMPYRYSVFIAQSWQL